MAYVKMSTTQCAARAINYGSHKLGEEREGLVAGGVNCDPKTAKQQMEMTRHTWGKNDKIQAHVLIQSFKEGEISPADANKLGVEFTKKLLAEKGLSDQEAVVFTHQDSIGKCIHNHIVVNSVNPTTGEKIDMHNELKRARTLSDALCKERGLSVIHEPAKTRYTQAEQGIVMRGAESWKDNIRTAVDQAAPISRDFADFKRRLQQQGVDVKLTGDKHETYSMDENGKMLKVRGNKLGADYDRSRVNDLSKTYGKAAQYELHCNFESVQKCHPSVKLSDGLKALKGVKEFLPDLQKIDQLSKKDAGQIVLDECAWIVKKGAKAAVMPIKLTAKTLDTIGSIVGHVPVVGKPVQFLLGVPSFFMKIVDHATNSPAPEKKKEKEPKNGYEVLHKWNKEQQALDKQEPPKQDKPPQQAAAQQQYAKQQESKNYDGSLKETLKMATDVDGKHVTPLDAKNLLAKQRAELDYTLLDKVDREALQEQRSLEREMRSW